MRLRHRRLPILALDEPEQREASARRTNYDVDRVLCPNSFKLDVRVGIKAKHSKEGCDVFLILPPGGIGGHKWWSFGVESRAGFLA